MPLPSFVPGRGSPARDGTPRRAAAVVLAGGSGQRVGSTLNKVYLPLAGRLILTWSLTWARQAVGIGTFVLVIRPDDAELAERMLRRESPGLPVAVVVGGSTRHESEEAALEHLAPAIESGAVDVVAVHDGARPLAAPSLWTSVIETARTVGGAVPALPAGGLLGVGADGHPVARFGGQGGQGGQGGLARVQTPQAFRAPELLAAYRQARTESFQGTDTSSTIETHGKLSVQVVAGSRTNLKITYPHDLFLAEQLLAGHGYRLT